MTERLTGFEIGILLGLISEVIENRKDVPLKYHELQEKLIRMAKNP